MAKKVNLVVEEESFNFIDTYNDFINYENMCNKIRDCSSSIVMNFFQIGKILFEINEKKLFLIEEYEDLYSFAEDKFKYKKTSVLNMINVYTKYCSEKKDSIDVKFKDYSYTSLVELLPVKKEEIVNSYSPDMSVKEIRKTKKVNKLYDFYNDFVDKFKEIKNLLDELIEEYNSLESYYKINVGYFSNNYNFKTVYYSLYLHSYSINNSPFYSCYLRGEVNKKTIYLGNGNNTNLYNMPLEEVREYIKDLISKHKKAVFDRIQSEKYISCMNDDISDYLTYPDNFEVGYLDDLYYYDNYIDGKLIFSIFTYVVYFILKDYHGDSDLSVTDIEYRNFSTENEYWLILKKVDTCIGYLIANYKEKYFKIVNESYEVISELYCYDINSSKLELMNLFNKIYGDLFKYFESKIIYTVDVEDEEKFN